VGSIRLRRWQHTALSRLEGDGQLDDFLAVATPGAGKTTFALVAAIRQLATRPDTRLIVVAPTAHLKSQWAESAARFGVQLDGRWDGRFLPEDLHGVATTYQQVASKPGAFAREARDGIVIFDELHHAGTDRAWGDACLSAFAGAQRRLALSGTPFRTDTNPIPFVHYDADGMSHADVTYGYADGLADQVVRPVRFEIMSGTASWIANDGEQIDASMEEHLSKALTSQRLRTAIAADGEWLARTLDAANEELTRIRSDGHTDAGGLVLATDQEHARAIATQLQHRTGQPTTIVLSDDPAASAQIERFSHGTSRWLVAVRMVSEGVDVPRLRVGVWATTTSTELFFRQAVGRLVRVGHGPYGPSTMFLPRDPRLVAFATSLQEERRHQLVRKQSTEDDLLAQAQQQRTTTDQLYQALGSQWGDGFTYATTSPDGRGNGGSTSGGAGSGAVEIEIPAVARTARGQGVLGSGRTGGRGRGGKPRTYQQLRQANSRAVAKISRENNISQRQVNAHLNAQVGVVSVTTATVSQLDARLDAAKQWLDRAADQAPLPLATSGGRRSPAPGGVWMRA